MSFLVGKKTLCVITGASRGIGAAIAQSLAKQCGIGSTIILIARNEKDLASVCERIHEDNADKKETDRVVLDLAKPNFDACNNIFIPYVRKPFDQAILVHNAATIGPLDKKVSQLDDSQELRDYFETNFDSTVLLNTAFIQSFPAEVVSSRVIVNISSGAAYGGLKGMHVYAAAKAGRDAFFRVVSVEEPSIRVLNFNPGPIITDMQKAVEHLAWDEGVKNWSRDGVKSGTFPTPDKAADTLIKILNQNEYESGSFINIHEKVLHFDYRNSSL